MNTITRQTVTPRKLVSLYRELSTGKQGAYLRLISIDDVQYVNRETETVGVLIEHVGLKLSDFDADLVEITVWGKDRMFTATVDTGWTEFDLVVDIVYP